MVGIIRYQTTQPTCKTPSGVFWSVACRIGLLSQAILYLNSIQASTDSENKDILLFVYKSVDLWIIFWSPICGIRLCFNIMQIFSCRIRGWSDMIFGLLAAGVRGACSPKPTFNLHLRIRFLFVKANFGAPFRRMAKSW